MQFDGLHSLLKKKKKHPAAEVGADASATAAVTTTTTATAPSGNEAGATASLPAASLDPYAAALQRAKQLKQQKEAEEEEERLARQQAAAQRKRSREPSAEAQSSGEAHQTAAAAVAATSQVSSGEAVVSPAPAKELKSQEAIAAEQVRGVHALQTCRDKLERYWVEAAVEKKSKGQSPPPPSSLSATQSPAQASSDSSYPAGSPLPAALAQYLLASFVSDSRATAATGEPETALLDREAALLAALSLEETGDASAPAPAAASPSSAGVSGVMDEAGELGDTIRVYWYLLALLWQHALDPLSLTAPRAGAVTRGAQDADLSRQGGWCYHVYLTLLGALPAEVRLTMGQRVAQAVEEWRGLSRTRQFALELLGYLYHDFTVLRSGDESQQCIVPADLRRSLHRMLVQHLQHERHHMAVRQDYVDVTMGTANWKLGLFSGGEVHMRRSMERVERNRISHLLNNEHATHLLQSVREMTNFAEQQKQTKVLDGFYRSL